MSDPPESVFVDEKKRKYSFADDEGELYRNYRLKGLLRYDNHTLQSLLVNFVTFGDIGPLLLRVDLPRDRQVTYPNPAIDGGKLSLSHAVPGKRIHFTYSTVTYVNLRARHGFVYAESFVLEPQ